jgi:hypothetical protein
MVSKSYEILPGESIGPFRLGMTRDEIEALRVCPSKILQDGATIYFPLVTGDEDSARWRFPRPGVYVSLDAAGKCVKIEALLSYNRTPPLFTLLGHIVNGMSTDEAVELFSAISPRVAFFYSGFELPPAGLRAIKWEAGDDHICAIEVRPRQARPG